MIQDSTVRLSASDGSTSPNFQRDDHAVEAAKIAARWRSHDAAKLAERFQNKEVLKRHKSLVLNLVIEDCQKLKDSDSVKPLDLVDRFRGLGDALEQSIYRQLEVQQYLEEHPELIPSEVDFPWPKVGERLEGYSVLEELGRGALARVYLCRQEALAGRLVVVKLGFGIDPHEAELLGRLRHPSIVPVHTAHEIPETGASLICMPFLGRSTLADLIAIAKEYRSPKPGNLIERAATQWLTASDQAILDTVEQESISRQSHSNQILALSLSLAEALQYAHAQGVLHGDIKPSNVLLTSDCRPLLLDFNLGREFSQDLGPVGGTLPYMAPELLSDLVHRPDDTLLRSTVATDIYSFGVLLHELFKGTTPFQQREGEDPVRAADRALQTAESCGAASQIGGDKSLGRLINQCLSLRPADRPASMQQVADALRRELRPARRVARSTREHKKRSAISISTVFLCLLGIGTWLANREPFFMRAYEAAVVDFKNQKHQDALNLLDQVLASKPDYSEARLLRARVYLQGEDFAKAKADLEFLAKHEDREKAMPLTGYFFNRNRQHAQAIPCYETAVKDGNRSTAVMNNLAMSWFRSTKSPLDRASRLEEAYRVIQKAVRRSPEAEQPRWNAVRIEAELASLSSSKAAEISRNNLNWLIAEFPENGNVNRLAFSLYIYWMQEKPELAGLALEQLELCHARGTAPTPEALNKQELYSVLRNYAGKAISVLGSRPGESRNSKALGEQPGLFMSPSDTST